MENSNMIKYINMMYITEIIIKITKIIDSIKINNK